MWVVIMVVFQNGALQLIDGTPQSNPQVFETYFECEKSEMKHYESMDGKKTKGMSMVGHLQTSFYIDEINLVQVRQCAQVTPRK